MVSVAGGLCAQDTAKIDPVRTEITVNEKIAAEAPASITVWQKLEIQKTPGVNVDDRLRSVPGFSLFRRSSSVAANPTTQGISLRGLGSSGASRTLVLWDGVPANDPFGGWVYWTRFSPEEIERVEIVRGASTSVFGDRAIGGSMQLFSRQAEPWRLRGGYEGGSNNTHQLTAGFSHLKPRWALSTDMRAFRTGGYYIVEGFRRGAADTRAGVDFAAGDVRLDYMGAKDKFFLKFDALTEDRANGTVVQRNSTSLGNLSGQYFREFGKDNLSLTGWHGREEFHSSFSTILVGRQSERLTMLQQVPAEVTGGAGIYRLQRSGANALFGGDFTRVEGYSNETSFPAGFASRGGVQWQRGAFAQTDVKAGPFKLFGGGRVHAAGKQGAFFSPSGGFVLGRKQWRARGSVFRSFRAPTLNELYREFRAGVTVTRANDALKPEFAFGSEVGVDYSGERTRASVTFFRTSLSDLITNVTLISTPTLIERQRRNAASALTRGVEANVTRQLRDLRLDLAWLFSESRYSTRLRIAQVPKHAGNATLSWVKGKTLLSGGIRGFSSQFEDDINTLRMPGYATMQVAARQGLTDQLAAVASFENLLDKRFYTSMAAVPNIGAPRLWRLGLRWDGKLRK
ncbi:MAG: TonB-dependent receptor [Acidobacteria bacterium]|nr:TonB-dependent receptor [Acidobacteriota bacterium]